jgi:O-antigen ligase
MLASSHPRTEQLGLQRAFGDQGTQSFWIERFLPSWLPLMLGLVLGPLAAELMLEGQWPLVAPVLLLVPATVLFIRYPSVAIILWLLIFPLFRRDDSSIRLVTYWVLHRTAIPAALGVVVLGDWLGLRSRRPVRFGAAELSMVVFLFIGLLNVMVLNESAPRSLVFLYDSIIVPFCLYWLVRLLVPTERDLKRLAWVGVVAVIGQSAVALLSWFAPGVLPAFWVIADRRTAGTIGSADQYSIILVFVAVLLVEAGMRSRSHLARSILLLTVALAFFGVFFSFSRASWLGAILVLIGLVLVYPRVALGMAVGLPLLVLVLGSGPLAGEAAWAWERLNTERTVDNRIIVYAASLELIQRKPAFGWGLGNHDVYAEQFMTRVGDVPVQAGVGITSHNAYLTIMAELGLFAFAAYMFPAGWWLLLTLKTWKRLPRTGFHGRSWLSMLWLAQLNQITISSFNDMFSHGTFVTSLWWITLGLIAAALWPYLEVRHGPPLSTSTEPGGAIVAPPQAIAPPPYRSTDGADGDAG